MEREPQNDEKSTGKQTPQLKVNEMNNYLDIIPG